MALTGAQLTTLRTNKHAHKFYLSVSIPRRLLTAQLSAGFARGATAIGYDTGTGTGYAAIASGQTLKVTTSRGVEYVRIKSVTGDQTSGTLTVAANEITWEDNAAIVVLEEYRLWPLLPRFTADGVFYKDWDTAYANQTNSIHPVVIANHRAGWLPDIGSFTYTEDLTRSYPLAIAIVTTYALEIEPSDGVTITDNSDGTFDVEINNAGQYWQKATITDTLLTEQVSYRRIFVHDADNPPYTDLTIGTLSGDSSRGWNFNATVFGDMTETDIPNGTLVILWQEQYIAGAESYPGAPAYAPNILFAGYANIDRTQADWDRTSMQLEAKSANQVLAEIYIASISMEAKINATNWYEYILILTTGRALHHLLKWHTTAMECCSVIGLDDGTVRYFAEMQAGSVQQTANQLLKAINAIFTADKTGQLYARQDVQLLSDAGRAAVSTGFAVTKQDIGTIEIQEQEPGAVSVFVSGIQRTSTSVTTAKPILSKAPGAAYSYGSRPVEVGNLVMGGQSEANTLSGRILARERARYSRWGWSNVPGGYIPALDVVMSEWVALTLDGTELDTGLAFTAWPGLVRSMQIRIQPALGVMSASVELEPEAYGFDGVTETWPTDPPDAVEDYEPPAEPENEDVPTDEVAPELLQPPALGNLVTWGATMGVYWSDGAGDVGWQARNAALTTGSNPGCVDPFRSDPASMGSLSAAGTPLWRCTTGAIYRSIDAGGTWLNVTPMDAPPNTWSDTTAPTVVDVEFARVSPSLTTAGTFTVIGRWQESDTVDTKWRSWLLITTDYGQTWEWNTVLVVATPENKVFSFAEGANGWVGMTNYLCEPEPPWPAHGDGLTSSIWNSDGAFAGACPDVGPGNFWADPEIGFGTYPYLSPHKRDLRIIFPQKSSFSAATGKIYRYGAGYSYGYFYLYENDSVALDPDDAGWDLVSSSSQFGNNLSYCGPVGFGGPVTYKIPQIRYLFSASDYFPAAAALYELTLTDFTTGPAELRIIHSTDRYIIGIADDELNLYTAQLSFIIKLTDCTNAEYDAGTYSAACFTPMDNGQAVFVFGYLDCDTGDTGVTGAQQVIASTDGGLTWASVEAGWSTDHCGAFIAGYDSGSGARYWAIRNAAAGCQLYSGIASLTAIGSTIAVFAVAPDGFAILDGQTMSVGGKTAAGATILFESYDGGTTWADQTGALPTSGVNKVLYA